MSRKTKTIRKRTSRKKQSPSLMRKWWEGISLEHKAGALQITLRLALLCLIVGGVAWGLGRLESHVRTTVNPKQNTPVRLQVSARPAWMPAELAYTIAKSFAVKGKARYDDATLTDEIAASAASNPWVSQVRSVRKARDAYGRPFVRVDCEFRRPAVRVAWRKQAYYVDDQGIRLKNSEIPSLIAIIPGPDGKPRQETFLERNRKEIPRNAKVWDIEYVTIELDGEMDPPPPAPGQKWDTEALLASGLRLSGLLKELEIPAGGRQRFRIDARNYAGRRNSEAPHLSFFAGESYFKFGRFPPSDYHYNVSVEDKMRILRDHIDRHNGRLAGTPGLDLQFDYQY